MSQLLGGWAGNALLLANEDRAQPPEYSTAYQSQYAGFDERILWPTRGALTGVGGGTSFSGSVGLMAYPQVWDWSSLAQQAAGQGVRLMSISGFTQNSAGAVLGNCIVKLFLTAGDIELGTTISNSVTGAFTVTSYTDSATCYIVAYLAGSPDVTGATVNTLQVT